MADSSVEKLASGVITRIRSLFINKYKKAGLTWFQVKQLKHLSVKGERTLSFFGKNIFFISPTEVFHAINEIYLEGLYDQTFKKSPFIIDCGANIGISIIRFKQLADDAMIIGFEPDERNFRLLEKNIRSHKLTNIELVKAAVWKENTQLSFLSEGSMSSMVTETGDGRHLDNVKAVRLKDYINREVDFLKIDIEGAEYVVLKDIEDRLSLVKNLFIEYHGAYAQTDQLVEILQIVKDQGFNIYIKEASDVFQAPFLRKRNYPGIWDVQLNIFCQRSNS